MMYEILTKCIFRHLNKIIHVQSERLRKSMEISDEYKMMLIGELAFDLWNSIIIMPLTDSMSKLLLDEFDKPRYKLPITTPLDTIAVILKSFVEIMEYDKINPLKVSIYIYLS